jgi:hypothetical protein
MGIVAEVIGVRVTVIAEMTDVAWPDGSPAAVTSLSTQVMSDVDNLFDLRDLIDEAVAKIKVRLTDI